MLKEENVVFCTHDKLKVQVINRFLIVNRIHRQESVTFCSQSIKLESSLKCNNNVQDISNPE